MTDNKLSVKSHQSGKIKLTQDFLDTVTALLHTPPMPKGKRKARKPAKKGKKR